MMIQNSQQGKMVQHVRSIARALSEVLRKIVSGGDIVSSGAGFGDLENDVEIRADIEMGNYIAEALLESGYFSEVLIEGMETRAGNPEAMYKAYVDPLDNSLGYKQRIGWVTGLPYTSVITVTDGKLFFFFLHAAIIELRDGIFWESSRVADGEWRVEMRSRLMHEKTRVMSVEEYKPREHMLAIELYYPRGRELIFKGFEGEKVYLVAPKSAAFEMMLVATGRTIGFVSTNQKGHELGAGVAMVLGAGGVAVNLDTGKSLLDTEYDFNSQTPVILAANEKIVDQLRKRFGLE